jgi:sugar O-acyltransferase (sialic acid O-acetyltransferase NeuD family)
MPRLGANIDTAKITSWHLEIGDSVQRGDIIAEIETEKSTFELEAEESGVLRYQAVKIGEEIPYNHPIALIAGPEENIDAEIEAIKSFTGTQSTDFIQNMDASVFDQTNEISEQIPDQRLNTLDKATPGAIRLANSKEVSEKILSQIAASTTRGFATERDVHKYLNLLPSYIYGASTGALQLLEAIQSDLKYRVVGIIDDNDAFESKTVQAIPVIGGFDSLIDKKQSENISVFVSSHSTNRRKIINRLNAETPWIELPPLIDKRTTILSHVVVEDGAFVEAGCVIGHEVQIGRGAILNIGAKLSHNCIVGDFTHLAIGTSISGAVSIGSNCLIGAGTSVNPAVTIGDNVIVSPGSAILNDIPSNVTVSGNPARIIGDSKRDTA